jgi:hypothetical protein
VHDVLTLTIVKVSVSGSPLWPSVMSCRKYAGLPIIPVRSGYGPAVSSGATAQLLVPEDPDDPPLPDPLVVELLDGVVGDDPQPTAAMSPAAPNTPSASRRLTR